MCGGSIRLLVTAAFIAQSAPLLGQELRSALAPDADAAQTTTGIHGNSALRAAPTEYGLQVKADKKRKPSEVAIETAHKQTSRQGTESDKSQINTSSIFGYTEGSDIDPKGEKSLSAEWNGRVGKRNGSFSALRGSIGAGYSPTDATNLFVSTSAANEQKTTDLYNSTFGSSGSLNTSISGGAKHQILRREQFGVGLSVQAAPYLMSSDGYPSSDQGFGSEFKVFADAVFIPDRLVGAINVAFTPEIWNRAAIHTSTLETSAAVAGELFDGVFAGAEVRHLKTYEGLLLNRVAGWALFAGPSLYIPVGRYGYIGVAWSIQIAGSAAEQPDAYLDLTNYERYQVRVKSGFSF
jgi:hypothetical protein